jgi:hypothetical protein
VCSCLLAVRRIAAFPGVIVSVAGRGQLPASPGTVSCACGLDTSVRGSGPLAAAARRALADVTPCVR